MIDLHCHLLPGIDDGPRSMAEAVELARASSNNGITHAVVTPHVFAGRWDNTLSNIEAHFLGFKKAIEEAQIDLTIHLGGEVHLLPESLSLLDANELPFIGGWGARRVVLLELPDGHIPVGAIQAVEFLLKHDIVTMIAHPERNKDVMRTAQKLLPLLDMGCLLQLTAASVCGLFGKPAHETALRLLDAGVVTAVATDAHNMAHRPPILAQAHAALTENYGLDAADELTINNPRRIIRARAALGIAH